jgi:hypothetical protein
MELVNWSGAIIGPGSEWFWAFAQFIVVVVSLLGIYRQLRSQGAANAVQRIETLEGRWHSPRMAYQRLDLAVHLRTHPPDQDGYLKARPILDFFTNLANLWEAGYLTLEEIESNWGASIQIWTALTARVVALRRRVERGNSLYDYESMIRGLRRLERKHNMTIPPLDDESLPGLLEYAILANRAILQQEAAFQSGVLPTVPEAEAVA